MGPQWEEESGPQVVKLFRRQNMLRSSDKAAVLTNLLETHPKSSSEISILEKQIERETKKLWRILDQIPRDDQELFATIEKNASDEKEESKEQEKTLETFGSDIGIPRWLRSNYSNSKGGKDKQDNVLYEKWCQGRLMWTIKHILSCYNVRVVQKGQISLSSFMYEYVQYFSLSNCWKMNFVNSLRKMSSTYHLALLFFEVVFGQLHESYFEDCSRMLRQLFNLFTDVDKLVHHGDQKGFIRCNHLHVILNHFFPNKSENDKNLLIEALIATNKHDPSISITTSKESITDAENFPVRYYTSFLGLNQKFSVQVVDLQKGKAI